MDRPDALIADIVEEDRLLRERLERCPATWRERPGSGGSLSFKDTLGHLAFWDSFAVQFFNRKLDGIGQEYAQPVNFEERNREEMRRIRQLPFAEVHELYQEATSNLISFLRNRWHDMSAQQRRDIRLPLKHRRHHRLLLENAFPYFAAGDAAREAEGEA
jgi:hypothetical protein